MSVPQIAVVEDHDFYRNGLCMALKRMKFVELAFEAVNGKEFLQKLLKNPVDIALVDVKMPGMGGYDVIIEAQKIRPGLRIMVLTMLDQEEIIQKFIDLGVHGYLLKNIDYKNLESAVKSVIDGQYYYSPEIMSFLTRKARTRHQDERQFSGRELEILQLIYDGFSNQDIAQKLFISVRTVANHRFNMMHKSGSKNTAGLINYGIKNKLIKL